MSGTDTRPSDGAGARRVAAALAYLLACAAAAADPGDIVARRISAHVHLDGRLDDAAWAEAPVFSGFVESFPRAGVPASFRTEVRVVYDDETLYVGITCFDPEPGAIVRQLARRDGNPTADQVEIALDTGADGRTAYDFTVNAAGVLRDQLLFADVNATDSWDAVWDAAVSVDARGWSAEVAIPFHQLRFSSAPEQRWGILVRRTIPRTHQVLDSVPIPREANPVNAGGLVVSRFGRLEGLVELNPRQGLELLPYAATRASLRPQYSDPSRPGPRLLDPGLDVGLDLKTRIARRLTLTAALNPDFGQVETDQVIQNLSNAEPFFPEKRPFFLEGLDIFQPVGSEYGSPQQLFYSRRIGIDAPILGAAKVTGAVRPGLDLGVLDSLVMGAGNASLVPVGYGSADPGALAPYEERPDRRWRFHSTLPFHLGPEDALPAAHPVTTNYFAAVARQRLGGRTTAGATFTAATPLEPRCRRSEFATDADYAAAGCASHGGNAVGVDLTVPGDWGGFAQLEASQAVGGPPEGRTLQDGTVLRAGDLGYGGHLRAGKLGGEPWRFDVTYVYEDPRLDLNAVGFQPLSNYQWADLDVHYVRPSGFGPFHAFQVDYNLDLNWSADGTSLPRGVNTSLAASLQLPGYQTIGAKVALELPQYDTREIAGAGVPFERIGDVLAVLILKSDPNRRLQASGDVFAYRTLRRGPFAPRTGVGLDLTAYWRPHDRLETRLDVAYGRKPQGPRWIETLPDETAVFGDQDPEFLSVTVRQQLVFTPRLTAQLYAQLFTSAIRYGRDFYGASLPQRRRVSTSDLAPLAYPGAPGGHDAVANVNAVVRWEYRLGSTLYVVYTRSQRELPAQGAPAPTSVAPAGLFRGPTIETVLVKWAWWWET
ncbi:carbohydrate binding family 9 domain-containing protein [Anaeromyxobacter oryzae]|uniref:Carbohydrate-binding domain-containing protein n=1 Tax=Anaeromyxobacter oryzae TaxID=2918170 RepID=A0ABM7WPG8_9BACT|nr:DUF5916 domain-containing protein [Anaeromyxobacter oryzae]BDG01361.1 hypothetical protein AMOR_03570 [Anaeromyxobacter oryzae]